MKTVAKKEEYPRFGFTKQGLETRKLFLHLPAGTEGTMTASVDLGTGTCAKGNVCGISMETKPSVEVCFGPKDVFLTEI